MGERYKVEACLLSDVGCHRSVNEDRINYIRPSDNRLLREKGSLAIVADGMGGHQAGQVASQLALDVISRSYYEQPRTKPIDALRQAFSTANKVLYEKANSAASLRGMGTTCSALVLCDAECCFAHVGDSRLYRLRENELILLTEDHTVVMALLKDGLLTPEEARNHPERHVITRALGTSPKVTVSSSRTPLPLCLGDYYVLCSDGLYDLVEDEEIKQAVLSASPNDACAQLTTLAKQRGGYDNISVGILALQPLFGPDKPVPPTLEITVPVL
ncbi:MAG: Stp1/IreP family PP2C-type Ser/Thr phosphatase [Candidatus Competibacteraceae bacterium]